MSSSSKDTASKPRLTPKRKVERDFEKAIENILKERRAMKSYSTSVWPALEKLWENPKRAIEAHNSVDMQNRLKGGQKGSQLVDHTANQQSAIVYRCGTVRKGDQRCEKCAASSGQRPIYEQCVVLDELVQGKKIGLGACSNCMWSNQGITCSFRKGKKKGGKGGDESEDEGSDSDDQEDGEEDDEPGDGDDEKDDKEPERKRDSDGT